MLTRFIFNSVSNFVWKEGEILDYESLAHEFMETMVQVRRRKSQKHINDSMHGENFVLFYISKNKGNIVPSDISNEMGISSARIAATLNSLEGKGFITRRIDGEDRRRILINLTDTGREQVNKQYKLIMGITTNMLKNLGDEDAVEFVRIMKKLVEKAPEDCM